MWLTSLFVCGFAHAAQTSALGSEVVVLKLTKSGVALRGGHGSWAYSFRMPERDRQLSIPELVVHYQVSGVVDAERSTLSLELDERPLQSVFLSGKAGSQRLLQVRLGRLDAGYHTLVFRANLRVSGDPCLEQHARAAWVRLDATSHLRFRQRGQLPATDTRGVLGRWRGEAYVQLRHTATTGSASTLTWLRAAELLEQVGTHASVEPAPQSLALATPESTGGRGMWRPLALRLAGSEEADVVLQARRSGMLIYGRDERALRRGLDALAWGKAPELCLSASICVLPRLNPKREAEVTAPEDQTRVFWIGQRGYSAGWFARGPGEHTLRLQWQRPPSWRIDRAPVLSLPILTSSSLDPRSRLTVMVNGNPISTFQVEGTATGSALLQASVPEEYWAAKTLDIRVVARLFQAEEVPCSWTASASTWLQIKPDADLRVERSEAAQDGIAEFFVHLSDRPRLRFEDVLTWEEVAVLAALLRPFALQYGGSSWALADHDAESPVVSVGRRPSDGAALRETKGGAWLDAARKLALPIRRPNNMVVLNLRRETSLAPLLEIFLSPFDDASEIDTPDYMSLRGQAVALVGKRWYSLRSQTSAVERKIRTQQVDRLAPTAATERIASQEERTLQLVNRIWAILLALIVLGASYWLKRRVTRRERAPADLEQAEG